MSIKTTNLKNGQNELDGKVIDMLNIMHVNNYILANIKKKNSQFLKKLRDKANIPSKPKSICEK